MSRFLRDVGLSVVVGVVVLGACDVRSAFRAHTGVVARAGDYELSVERLAEIVAASDVIPRRRDVLERIANLWIDYALFAQRVAEGDSLLDSATVLQTMWHQAQVQLIAYYHDDLVADRVTLDEARVDSAYEAGDLRLLYHILVRTNAGMSEDEKVERRWRAEQLRRTALQGPAGWREANLANEDSVARDNGGSLGLVQRGTTAPALDSVAFELAPGEISEVTESQYGYHILRRPRLDEVRAEFRQALLDAVTRQMDRAFLKEVEARWEIKVGPDAARPMREAARDVIRAKQSPKVLGSSRNGKFTTADFARWLQVLPPERTGEVLRSSDEQLIEFGRGLIRNSVLEAEAKNAGHKLTEQDYQDLQRLLAADLDQMKKAMGLDSLLAPESNADRGVAVDSAVLHYLRAVVGDLAKMVILPPALADKLRRESEWKVFHSGVNRAVERSERIRSGRSQ